jgi:hypothetical protein
MRPESWTAHCGARTHRVECRLTLADPRDRDAVCCITHEHVAEAETPGLPARWQVRGQEYDSLRTPCGHLFHASSLLLHFLVNDMRCPVCRQGAAVKADLACVPASVAAAFSCRLEQAAAEVPQLLDLRLHTSAQELEAGLQLIVEVHSEADVTVLSSSLACVPEAATPDLPAYPVLQAQQSFYRRLERHLHSQPTPVVLVVRLCHVLLEESISSEPLHESVYRRMASSERPTRSLGLLRHLRVGGVPCAELLPSSVLRATFMLRLHREYVHLLLLSQLRQYITEYME